MPLSAPARQLLSEIREEQASKRRPLGEYVFPSIGGTGHVVEIKRVWRNICKAAAISAYASTICATASPANWRAVVRACR